MKKVLIIGQAMPKPPYPKQPFGRTKLYIWLSSINITQDIIDNSFEFGALVSYFPGSKNGSHLVPTKQMIKDDMPQLKRQCNTFKPDILIPVGKLAIQYALQIEKISLKDCIGRKYFRKPFGLYNSEISIIPLPHPSGASSWFYNEENKKLLNKALEVLKDSIA